MTISAIIVADSVEPSGSRLTTVLCRYPLIIHNEVMTHRDFSRNAASNRAIPFKKMRDDIQADPFVPMVWTKNQPGMQGYEEMNPADAKVAKAVWLYSLQDAMAGARKLDALGCHKQIVNRLLMPFMHIAVVISSTRWSNFFALRLHKTAEPHMRLLAGRIWTAIRNSVPTQLDYGDWHLPFAGPESGLSISDRLMLSVARCASTSYRTVDEYEMTVERAHALYDRLIHAQPMHASPAEHQASVDRDPGLRFCGNFGPGWVQHRKTLPMEYIDDDEMAALGKGSDWHVDLGLASSDP